MHPIKTSRSKRENKKPSEMAGFWLGEDLYLGAFSGTPGRFGIHFDGHVNDVHVVVGRAFLRRVLESLLHGDRRSRSSSSLSEAKVRVHET
jgi:hypothetical protein